MSDTPIGPEGPIRPGGSGSHRPSKVMLRAEGGGDDSATQLDPANQSLAEALRITYGVLQAAMVVLFILFVLSGFQSIREGESGVRLLFGRKSAELDKGLKFSFPYPLGELVKVQTGNVPLEDSSFWPMLTDEQRAMSMQQLATLGKFSLTPGQDGSLITGDSNLAHVKWKVVYRRDRPAAFAQNMLPEDEQSIVRSAVQRGILQSVATIRIDDLLKQSSSDEGSVAARARQIAQRMLDNLDSGVHVDQLTLQDKAPPFSVYSAFSSVQSMQQKVGQNLEQAQGAARNALNSVAGGAHEALVKQIDLYEQAVERGDTAEQERVMATIHAIFDGRPVEIDGQRVENAIAGEVTTILNDARQYRTSIVNQRRAELSLFRAKLEQFRSNPSVVVQRDWADAMTRFMSRDSVETYANPPGTDTIELLISRDPAIAKAMETARKLLENLNAEKARQERQKKQNLKTDTEATTASGS